MEVILEKKLAVNGQSRVDLKIKEFPENFLGMSFDLLLKDKSVQFDRFVLSEDVLKLEKTAQPIFMAKEMVNQIVFGITRKAENLPLQENGFLGSFYFDGAVSNLEIKNSVFSIYDSGRVDLKDVQWKIIDGLAENSFSQAELGDLKQEGLSDLKSPVQASMSANSVNKLLHVDEENLTDTLLETNFSAEELEKMFNLEKPVDYSFVWLIIIGILALAALFFAWLINKKGLFQRRTEVRLIGEVIDA